MFCDQVGIRCRSHTEIFILEKSHFWYLNTVKLELSKDCVANNMNLVFYVKNLAILTGLQNKQPDNSKQVYNACKKVH